MADLLGPASLNAVTTRPTDDRTIGASDTWFKDCTSPALQDGTQIRAAVLNALLGQLRRAIRGMGVTEKALTDPAYDDMLLEAIQAASANAILYPDALLAVPLFPEIQTTSKVLAFTTSTGQIIVNAGQTFVMRGVRRISTDSYTLAQRTFATVANKTYHLRFDLNNGFRLVDLASGTYNPGAAAETDAVFDSALDDMLVARVVTNGSNALTVTALVNAAVLRSAFTASLTGLGNNAETGTWSAGLNWARRPVISYGFSTRTVREASYNDLDESVDGTLTTRYAASGNYLIDWPEVGAGLIVVSGLAIA